MSLSFDPSVYNMNPNAHPYFIEFLNEDMRWSVFLGQNWKI